MHRGHYRVVVDQKGVHGMFDPGQLDEQQVTIWLEGERHVNVAPEMLVSQDDTYHLPITFAELERQRPQEAPIRQAIGDNGETEP